jgi:hypothetical protein
MVHAKALRREALMAVDYTAHAFSKRFPAKVNEQPKGLLHQSEIGQQLLYVNAAEPLNRFDLDDQPRPDDQINFERAVKLHSVEREVDRLLPDD